MYGLIGDQLCAVDVTWKWWKALFVCEDPDERNALLHRASGVSFELQFLGRNFIVLALWAMIHDTDPSVVSFKNTIKCLGKCYGTEAALSSQRMLSDLIDSTKSIHWHRNNTVAHRNREALASGVPEDKKLSIEAIDQTIRQTHELLNTIRQSAGDTQIAFDSAQRVDAELLYLLRAAGALKDVRVAVYSGEAGFVVDRLRAHYEKRA